MKEKRKKEGYKGVRAFRKSRNYFAEAMACMGISGMSIGKDKSLARARQQHLDMIRRTVNRVS